MNREKCFVVNGKDNGSSETMKQEITVHYREELKLEDKSVQYAKHSRPRADVQFRVEKFRKESQKNEES
jgi:hypothetical protein